MVGLNDLQGGLVYDEFNESVSGIDINGDSDFDTKIGVLAYGDDTSNVGGITSVIFLENPMTQILASQIYVDNVIVP
jgi:hypothetical protein